MHNRPHIFMFVALTLGLLAGCESEKPRPKESTLVSPYVGVRTLAVAPAINQSGSRDFDPLTVSDSVYGELQQVAGLNVLPVNRTLAAMQKLGLRNITTVEAAQQLIEVLGADGLIVPAITLYDPYRPPVIGMTLQMYTGKHVPAQPEPVARQITGKPLGPSDAFAANGPQPAAQVTAVFNAGNQTVLAELYDFSQGRTNYESALQQDRFLADIDGYTRFVSHAMVRRLMELERVRAADR